ncbi:hypothetical protein [Methylobacterium sp. ID0610]|uniref:hypothetical protein n=1 Tax=Methylobacterium carpenticola TaxID=3344827 RepID=UPI0036CEDCC8
MAKADKHHMGPGTQGKGSGTGAMTELPDGILPENMVLKNRDKSQHSDERGLDSKYVQTEQYQDHAANRRDFDENGAPRGGRSTGGDNTSGTGAPMTTVSGDDSSLTSQHRR